MNGKKIVIVQPKSGPWDLAGQRPPDSLLAISALPYASGYDVRIIDQRIDRKWKESLKRELKDAFLFGTTSMTGPQIKYALEASKFVKENSYVPVVWGGIHASLLPEQTIQNRYIDMVVCGEGDYALLELIKALEQDNLLSVKGLYYKQNGQIRKTPERDLINNLDKLLDFPYKLINIQRYHGINLQEGRGITLITSRGCPYRCAFCYNTVYNKNRWRGMSAKRVVEMIKRVTKEFGVKNIFFEDDNFCASVERFEEIIDRILEEKIDIRWGLLGVRADTLKRMSDNLLAKAVKAGCVSVDIGVESGSNRIIDLVIKGVTTQDIIGLNKRLVKFFPRTKYTFIMGLPTETESELLESVRLALRLIKDNPSALTLFFAFCAYPGTKLFNLAKEYGFKEPNTLEEWADINYETAFLFNPWLNKKMSKMIQNLGFTSFFINRNTQYKINSAFFRGLALLYQPIAKIRFENNIYSFPVERWLVAFLIKTWSRISVKLANL